jgi:hypothetical protein
MLPLPEKQKFRMSKYLWKNIHMHISTFYMFMHSFVKNIHIYRLCKIYKKKWHKKAYFSTKSCYFYIGHIKKSFFSKELFVGTYDMEMYTQHFSLFFNIFKYVENVFQIKEAYAPRSQNVMSTTYVFPLIDP